MTLHKLGDEDLPEGQPPPKSITLDFGMSEEEWDKTYGDWRYQCDWCQKAYGLKAWRGFELSVDDFSGLSSYDADVWSKLLKGDAHFCDARCAGRYFLDTVSKYEIQIQLEPGS